jgi:hypothetical protein
MLGWRKVPAGSKITRSEAFTISPVWAPPFVVFEMTVSRVSDGGSELA